MMRYFENILEVIGKTPLVKLNALAEGLRPTILVKVEYMNPGGSVKDRIGLAMIEEAEKRGLLKPGSTIVEPTSGNTGVGLALVAALKGYRTIFVMPDKMSKEKEHLLRAYGAEVIWAPTNVAPDNPRSYYKVAERIAREIPDSFSPNQYFNDKNPEAHYRTTGPEIWEDTEGKITHFVAGVGTGGTITGAARYLKEMKPGIKIIGVDPEGSIYHHEMDKTRGEVRPYKVEGIGEDFVPMTVDLDIIDEMVVVGDGESFRIARELAEKEGLLVGGSSGSAVLGALKYSEDLTEEDVVVVLLPDTGRNYLSTVHNHSWLEANGFGTGE